MRSNYREKCLIKTKLTFAILDKISLGSAKGSSFIQFNFTNTDGKVVTTDHIGHFSICERGMVKGDTILIKYSIEDNNVAQIVKCYWNEELREKYVKSN